jgi:hypothetical protein
VLAANRFAHLLTETRRRVREPETIAVIRDLSIIVTAGVFVIILVPAGILHFRLYRSLSRADCSMENITSKAPQSVRGRYRACRMW